MNVTGQESSFSFRRDEVRKRLIRTGRRDNLYLDGVLVSKVYFCHFNNIGIL